MIGIRAKRSPAFSTRLARCRMLRPPTFLERQLEADADEAQKCATLALPGLGGVIRLQQTSFEAAGTGGLMWPAASVLCRWLSSQTLQGANVLELGCGTGAVGIYCAACGAARVLLTDSAEGVLENARRNITLNSGTLGAADGSHGSTRPRA